MREASKTNKLLIKEELSLLKGKGIDIGCGDDPITDDCQRFDIGDGDANEITTFVKDVNSYDYVVSFHCLEHMFSPEKTIQNWWQLVKPGGVMIIVVPDEDLYEQGYWPSIFNSDHKATFTLSKQYSWSTVSYNLFDLANLLTDSDTISVRLQDHGYNRRQYIHKHWPRKIAHFFAKVRYVLYVYIKSKFTIGFVDVIYKLMRLPVDQTLGNATAQNILIVTKKT